MYTCGNPLCAHDFANLGPPKHLFCSKCKIEPYCSRECQVVHWKIHKKLCKVVADLAESQAHGPALIEYEKKCRKAFDRWNKYNAQLIQVIELYSLENKFKDHICDIKLEYFPDATTNYMIKIIKVEPSPILSQPLSLQHQVNQIISQSTPEVHHYATIFQFINAPINIPPLMIINPVNIAVNNILMIKSMLPTMESAMILANKNEGEAI